MLHKKNIFNMYNCVDADAISVFNKKINKSQRSQKCFTAWRKFA